jgi:hypothetical protein
LVLGLACTILSSHIAAINWADNNPYYYFTPSLYFEYQTAPQQQNPTYPIEETNLFSPAPRAIVEKIAILNLQRQISQVKREMERT